MVEQRRFRRVTAETPSDLGAFEERIVATETAVQDVKGQLSTVRQEMNDKFDAFSASLSRVADSLGKKIDEQTKATANAGRTDWLAFFSAAAVLVSIVGTVGYLAISPINAELSRLDADLRVVATQSASREDLHDAVAYGGSRLDRLEDRLDKLTDRDVPKDEEQSYRTTAADQMKSIWQRLDALSDRSAK